MVVAAVSDDGPESESEPERDLNSSPISPRPIAPIAPIAVDEQTPAFLSGKIGELTAEIILLEERVEALDSQIKTKDEQISSLVSQKQTLQAKIARRDREANKAWEQVNALEQNDKDLRRMIVVKNRELSKLSKHSDHLHTIVLEHSERLAVFARRTSFAEARSAALEAAWPVSVPMP